LALDAQQETLDTHRALYEAVPFPLYDYLDVIHGHGTVALELEQESVTPVQGKLPRGRESTIDFVVCDFDDGIALSGICMAFTGTSTQVIGAAPTSGFWEHVSRQPSPDVPVSQSHEHKYWEGMKIPMAAIPWTTFTEQRNLSGVLEVDDEQMYAASLVARKHFNLHLEPDEVVPLAVALYNADFRRLAVQVCRDINGPTVGIILRSRRADRVVTSLLNVR
jgi:threonine dehydratase